MVSSSFPFATDVEVALINWALCLMHGDPEHAKNIWYVVFQSKIEPRWEKLVYWNETYYKLPSHAQWLEEA